MTYNDAIYEVSVTRDQMLDVLDAIDILDGGRKRKPKKKELGLSVEDITTREEYLREGERIAREEKNNRWERADWLLLGENRGEWGETYEDAVKIFGRSENTLSRDAGVARLFPRNERFSSLTFEHHKEVKKYPPKVRRAMLRRASDRNWTITPLRKFKKRYDAFKAFLGDDDNEDKVTQLETSLKTVNLNMTGTAEEILEAVETKLREISERCDAEKLFLNSEITYFKPEDS